MEFEVRMPASMVTGKDLPGSAREGVDVRPMSLLVLPQTFGQDGRIESKADLYIGLHADYLENRSRALEGDSA